MNTQKIASQIQKTFSQETYEGIDLAEELLVRWERRDIMSKPAGKPVERFAVFQKGRTSIILNYSEDTLNHVEKTTSRKDYNDYMESIRS